MTDKTFCWGGVGGDTLGRSGQAGFVDTRFRERFGTAALITLIGAVPGALVDSDDNDVVVELAEDVGADLQNVTNSILDDYLSLPPIIYIDQGAAMSIFVNRDLVF